MALKHHLRLNKKQLGEISKVKFNYGFNSEDDDRNENPNYYYMANSLKSSIKNFYIDLEVKYKKRSIDLSVPASIDYIEIIFVDQFDISNYSNNYFSLFGLEATKFTIFNRRGLFAIIDKVKFEFFIKNVNAFIECNLMDHPETLFSSYIKYIKKFKLLTSIDILKFNLDEVGNVVYVSLIELPLDLVLQNKLISALLQYISSNNVSYNYIEAENRVELIDVSASVLDTIAENYDIISSITSSLSSVIKPSTFNYVKREYSFEINNADEELPIIGIIDTGISMSSPLAPIVIPDDEFTIDGDPFIDEAGTHRLGHGTSIAGLASLGRFNHENKFQGIINADAKLLSIKISNKSRGYILESELIKMLYKACAKYPNLKIFVLTMCYKKCKETNEEYSAYTYTLDKFAHDTGSIIFICTGNNNDVINKISDYNIEYLEGEETNLCTPADSMNNVIVGAAAENLNGGGFFGISPGREYPTMYTRKCHINLRSIYSKNKTNKHYFKPDIIECGGDFGIYSDQIDWTDDAAISVLSARPEIGFVYETGTSLSAPLAANTAVKLLKIYPTLKMQSVKALLINSASLSNIKFPLKKEELKSFVAGHGIVNLDSCLYSTENSPTLILEDNIKDDELKIYPINFPDYLLKHDLGKRNGILKITATLCFSFNPLLNNQLSYNPIHMAFCFFKNQTADEIVARSQDSFSKLKNSLTWSQNGRYRSKPIPYSNAQKLRFYIDLNNLIEEDLTIKLAIQARITNQVIGGLPSEYPREFPFSLVIKLEENIKNNTGKLYDEIQLVNRLEVLETIDLEGIVS